MKTVLSLLLLAASALAQTATRTVQLSWTPSTSAGVTGTIVQNALASTGPWTQIGCVGTVPGSTCVAGSTATTSTYSDTQNVGVTVWYQVIAVAPDCTPTTPATAACGQSAPSSPASTTVPAKPAAITTIVVSVK